MSSIADKKILSPISRAVLMRNPRMDTLIERLGDSKEFWDLVAGYGALVLLDSDTDYPGELLISREEFCAQLTAEIEHQDQCISDANSEWESA